MASNSTLVFFLLLAVVPITTLAVEYIVGDGSGWTTNFDYQAWAQGKNFLVGDKLVFKYPVGAHNVFRVNGTGFRNCIKPPVDQALASGNDTIVLATLGNKWYICGVGEHCESAGQKLAITVLPSAAPAPSWGIPYVPGTPMSSPSIAPSPLSPSSGEDTEKWEYGAPGPAPVEDEPGWGYGGPAPAPSDGAGYSANKRPFINIFKA